MAKRSSLLDMLGAPKPDLRAKPDCTICGVLVTRKNFGMSSSSFEDGWSQPKFYCLGCYLKPEAIGI